MDKYDKAVNAIKEKFINKANDAFIGAVDDVLDQLYDEMNYLFNESFRQYYK